MIHSGIVLHRPARNRGALPWVFAGLLPLAMLTGCANHSENNFTVGSVQSTYKTKHPIVIDEKAQTLDVPVTSSMHSLGRPALSSVEGYGSRFRLNANGSITIMVPAGSANEAAARRVVPGIVSALQKAGVPRSKIRTSTYYAASYGSTSPIRLTYTTLGASVEQCGKWPEDLASVNRQNQNFHNFGCAYQNNLAAMIANPADLLTPRGMTPIDAERRNVAIENYRNGDVGTDEPRGSAIE